MSAFHDFNDQNHSQNQNRFGQDAPFRLAPAPPGQLSIDLLDYATLPKPRPSRQGQRCSPTAPVPQLSRLIQDGRGKFMFIGDSANLSFLQSIRRLVRDSLGPCAFADDPLRHLLVEATPEGRGNWISEIVKRPTPRPDPERARYLVRWYMRATSCVLNLSDEFEIQASLSRWLESSHDGPEQDANNAIFFLILAIGAQTCPEHLDDLAEQYFNYGQFLTVSGIMEDPSIATIQAYVLITMYLLGASRRNAAFMHLGIAVRAAYALGIHRDDINALFDRPEYVVRERLWNVLRVLDLFMSASLGRPPATCETRDTKAHANYSASNDLCAIFEAVLTQVYSKRMVLPQALERISEHHRQWAVKFMSGLAVDNIRPSEYIDTDQGEREPNIGLYHLKEAYYWTIMLLARPFLIESVSRHVSQTTTAASAGTSTPPTTSSPSDQVLAYACVDSAIRTVDLLRGLVTSRSPVPKRLPFVVNSLFVAALVLGLAQFADMDRAFPLERGLAGARALLAVFGRHDAVARRARHIADDLHAACGAYRDGRARRKMERQSLLIGGLFGSVHGREALSPPAEARGARHHHRQAATYGGALGSEAGDGEADGHGHEHGGSFGAGTQPFVGMDDHESLLMLPDLAGMAGMALPLSPQTLVFDSFDDDIPLASAVDPNLLQEEGHGVLGEGFRSGFFGLGGVDC